MAFYNKKMSEVTLKLKSDWPILVMYVSIYIILQQQITNCPPLTLGHAREKEFSRSMTLRKISELEKYP